MKSKTNQFLRVLVVILLVLLAVQYELGMAVNLSPDLPSLSPFGFSLGGVLAALQQAGSTALAHGLMGSFLWLLSVLTLILSLSSKQRRLQIFSGLGFVFISLAATGGILFVLSGFQADRFSEMMASSFLLSFIFYFLELYFLKPGKSNQTE